MPGPTDVEIANLALIDLGQPAVSAFTDDGKAARLLRAIYEPTVKDVLRHHSWRCARKKVVLADDPDATPAFGFSNACALPADFVRVVRVNDHLDKFEVVGAHLHIDDDAPELTYTARVDEALFDPGLVSVIAARLAMRLCIPLTDNATAAQGLQKVHETTLADAKFADALDGAPEDNPIGTWAEARLSEA
jgi:hypothetical protein